MYRFTLLVVFVTLLGGSIVQAASYEKTDGTIVGLLDIYGSPHSYSGNNLEPSAYLANADLHDADLSFANLYNANLIALRIRPLTRSMVVVVNPAEYRLDCQPGAIGKIVHSASLGYQTGQQRTTG